MRTHLVRKWPLRGRSRFVCWNIRRVCLWLLCNVHFVQSTQRTIATWPHWPKGTDHCSSLEYRCTHVDACVARTWIPYRCVPCHPCSTHRKTLVVKKKKKLFQFSCGCEQFHCGRSFGFLVINVCNHREHYETPCICVITENIMKRPVYVLHKTDNTRGAGRECGWFSKPWNASVRPGQYRQVYSAVRFGGSILNWLYVLTNANEQRSCWNLVPY